MGRHLSFTSGLDSPSRQLVLDLARELEQVKLHCNELKKVKAIERQTFYERLNVIDLEVAAEHNAALDKVAAQRDKVREEAEHTLKEHIRAEEAERKRLEEEARKEKERIEKERAEKLRREQEEAARLEAKRRAEEEARKKAAEEAERAKRAAQEERERQERQRLEEEKKKRDAEEQKAAQRKAEASKQAQLAQQKKFGAARLTEHEAKIHQRYIELHQHLKKFRQWLRDESKSNPALKQVMGDMRRTIKKCVGQLREGKGTNKGQVSLFSTQVPSHRNVTFQLIGRTA